MRNRRFIISLILLFSLLAGAQNSVPPKAYRAFLQQDLKLWEQSIQDFKQKNNTPGETEKLQLIQLYYGYTAQLLGNKENQKAAEAIRQAEELIEEILKNNPRQGEALNYKGVFLSYKIPFNKLKAPLLGKESLSLINQAIRLAPNSPQVLFDKGNSLYYVPKIMGGSKKEALRHFRKAISLIEKQKQTSNNWIYIQLLFQEAHSLELLGQKEEAKRTYEKVLRVEPDFKIAKKYYDQFLIKTK